jgi:alkylation response protein AidB-like acyl-CoA dehydrogenase
MMLRRPFTEEQEMFRDAYRRFLEAELVPHRDDWWETGIIPREIFRKAGEQGFLAVWVDEAYGGLGLKDFRFEQIMIEEIARCQETGFMSPLNSRLIAPYIADFGSEEQRQRFLPGIVTGDTLLMIAMSEPQAGSDLAGMKTRAVDNGDHWVLNGSKTWISNGINAELAIVAAKSDPDSPRTIGLFLVEEGMEGFTRGKPLKKMGLLSQDTAELFFSDVKVPKENVLGDPARGFHYMMKNLAEERLICACQSIAACQTAFDLTVEYVRERKMFGGVLSDMQNTRFTMAGLRAKIDTAQSHVDRCVEVHNAGDLSSAEAAGAKLVCSELQAEVVDSCLQFFGGAGYMDEYPISRMYRDARVTRIYAGASEIMKELISREIFPRQR